MLTVSAKIQQQVEKHPKGRLQTLIHYVNEETIKEAHNQMKANKAMGVDKVDKVKYGTNINENVKSLIARMKQFSYRPQPVRRTYIPKEGSEKLRPLGIPSYEDKLVQSVMAEILDIIYEPEFLDCSHGFRAGRDCHGAVQQLNKHLMSFTTWVVDVDIQGYFDNVNHEWMMKFLEHRIGDETFLRYIKRFLKSGYMDKGIHINTETGVPQGGNISPVLANVYLHYALDLWFEKVVKKAVKGRAEMVRYADDIVFCFEHKEDAETFYNELKERLNKFGLNLSEEKSKIIPFSRKSEIESGKFDFLGFTHIISKSQKGYKVVKYRTSEKKLKSKKVKIKKFISGNIQTPIAVLIRKINVRLRGHYNYYGISHNTEKLRGFYNYSKYILFKALNRRSQRKSVTWDQFSGLLKMFPLLEPTITFRLF